MQTTELVTTNGSGHAPVVLSAKGRQYSLDDLWAVSEAASKSRLFGITAPEQAYTLMLLCESEGLNPIEALRRYHIIQGRPAMRADTMLA